MYGAPETEKFNTYCSLHGTKSSYNKRKVVIFTKVSKTQLYSQAITNGKRKGFFKGQW